MKRLRKYRKAVLLAAGCGIAAVALVFPFVPTETRQGVDMIVTRREIPAYEKAFDFVQRDLKYRDLAGRITQGRRTHLERVMAVYEWTRQNIRDTPPGFPIVDDHIWHIVVRGYGVHDQKADVFATLAAYAGVRTFWTLLRAPTACRYLPMSFAHVDGRWIVIDVVNGLTFENARNMPAAVDDIVGDRSIVARAAAGRQYRGVPYADYFENFCPAAVPRTLRAEKQMPVPRLLFEARALVGLGDPRPRGDDTDLPLCNRSPSPCKGEVP